MMNHQISRPRASGRSAFNHRPIAPWRPRFGWPGAMNSGSGENLQDIIFSHKYNDIWLHVYIYIYIMCMYIYIYINHYKPLWFFCLQTPLEGCARVECLGLPRQHPHKDHRINRCAGLHLPIISLGKEGTVHLYTSWISLISMDGWMDG